MHVFSLRVPPAVLLPEHDTHGNHDPKDIQDTHEAEQRIDAGAQGDHDHHDYQQASARDRGRRHWEAVDSGQLPKNREIGSESIDRIPLSSCPEEAYRSGPGSDAAST